MQNKIKETTEKLNNGMLTKDEADKILLDLFYFSETHISRQAYKEGFDAATESLISANKIVQQTLIKNIAIKQ